MTATQPSGSVAAYRRHYLPSAAGRPDDGSILVTFYGTSTLLFDDGRTQFLVDAFLTRPSRAAVMESLTTGAALIGSDPATVDAWMAWPEVRSPAAIFATHSHHDHALDVAAVALRTGAQVHGSESTLNIARGGGVPESQLTRFRIGKAVSVGDFTVTVLPGHHPENPPR